MDSFEGVIFDDKLEDAIKDQLEWGTHRNREDSGPGDWVLRAWYAVSHEGKQKLSRIIHRMLLNDSLKVRLNALSVLDVCSPMVIPEILVDIAIYHFELFEGAHYPGISQDRDRGQDLLHLAAAHGKDKLADAFRRKAAMDKEYGSSVLISLVESDSTWTLKNLKKIINPEIDPEGTRLHILVKGLKPNSQKLQQAIKELIRIHPPWSKKLADILQQELKNPKIYLKLLDLSQTD